jgi:hypothetical protein
MRLEDAVDEYLGEWVRGQPPADATKEWYRTALKNHATLEPFKDRWNLVSREGNQFLWQASRLLLQNMGEERRVTRQTARRCLIEAHHAHLAKALRTGVLSEHAVIAGAKKRLAEKTRSDGFYVVPIHFAPSAKNTRFRIGPALILSRSLFEADHKAAIATQADGTGGFGDRAVEEWSAYSERYDHFIVVEVCKHEAEMAWKTAREVAEYILNLVRIKFGFYHMDDVRVGNGFVWEISQARVYFEESGAANLSLSSGPWASHLDDKWTRAFDDDVGGSAPLLASLALWMASGNDPRSPVLERLRYANTLIAEAFSEPHDRIRLVRLVSALETLAVVSGGKKSEALAWRCALAGGWEDCGRAVQIDDDVRYAYNVRNAVVHGDYPDNEEAVAAFYRLERHLAHIYIGFLHMHAKVQRRYRPTHVRHIRKAFDRHLDAFFWDLENDT